MGQRCVNILARDTERGDLPMQSHDTSVRIPLRARDGSVRAYAIVDAADAEWVNQWRWHLSSGYATRNVRVPWAPRGTFQVLRLHRVLLGLTHGDGLDGDHRDRDKLNCQRANIRAVTHDQNIQNVPGRSGHSQYRGVTWNKTVGKWQSRIRVDRKDVHLGYFTDEREAGDAARSARLRLLPFTVEEL